MRRNSDNKRIDKYIHILVAQHFISNSENKKYVNHLDTKRENNIWTNLEWSTAKENTDYTLKLKHMTRDGKGKYVGLINEYK